MAFGRAGVARSTVVILIVANSACANAQTAALDKTSAAGVMTPAGFRSSMTVFPTGFWSPINA